jgi:hypothetical protein
MEKSFDFLDRGKKRGQHILRNSIQKDFNRLKKFQKTYSLDIRRSIIMRVNKHSSFFCHPDKYSIGKVKRYDIVLD